MDRTTDVLFIAPPAMFMTYAWGEGINIENFY